MEGVVFISLAGVASLAWAASLSLSPKATDDTLNYGDNTFYLKYDAGAKHAIPDVTIGSGPRVVIEVQECAQVSDKELMARRTDLKIRDDDTFMLVCGKVKNMLSLVFKWSEHAIVQKLTNQIRYLVEHEGKEILMVGSGGGGAIASQVAVNLNGDEAISTKLHVATFGSFFVPEPREVKNVDIVHYMIIDDIATMTNGLKTPNYGMYDEKKRVRWIDMGSDRVEKRSVDWEPRWDIQGSYDKYVMAVVKNGDYGISLSDTQLEAVFNPDAPAKQETP